MSQSVKTPKGAYITLAAGFGLGALAMVGLRSGIVSPAAWAQQTGANLHTVSGISTENLAALHNLDNSFANLAEFVAPAVVDIRASSKRSMAPDGERMPARSGEGSGFIFRADGYILTNDHVVDGADTVKVMLKDGHQYDGKVVRAESSDLAIIKINASNLPYLAFADSATLKPGQMCMAIGSPFGMLNSVTFGHISALGRATPIASDMQERYYPDLIQTDAAINMGNSGGPLVNMDGQVVGINTAIYSPTGTSAGIGFAIPSNQAKFISDMLVSKGKVTRAMIGLVPDNLLDYQKKEKGLSGGAVVATIEPKSPADQAGIKIGDIIVKIGSTPVNSQLDLRNAMLIYSPGTTIPVQLLRNGKAMSVNVKLEVYKQPESMVQPLPQGGQSFGDGPEFFDGPNSKLFKQFDDQFGNRRQGNSGKTDDGDVPPIRDGQAHLGVRVGSPSADLQSQFNIPASAKGAVVVSVEPGSMGEKLGMQPGDVITGLGGKPINSAEDLTKAMQGIKWGDSSKVKFTHYDDGSTVVQERTFTFR